ncbi:hypothetical protein acdb102_17260 [Acidothermaceae bacterium B102]|nr:hypothetical protein acdb102_17260 [Acidothermaceae bacterium B102]
MKLGRLPGRAQSNTASYAGLGRLYVEHPDFRARYDRCDPGLAEFLSAAMAAYAPRLA